MTLGQVSGELITARLGSTSLIHQFPAVLQAPRSDGRRDTVGAVTKARDALKRALNGLPDLQAASGLLIRLPSPLRACGNNPSTGVTMTTSTQEVRRTRHAVPGSRACPKIGECASDQIEER